jgi:hypothetical protein
MAAEKTQIEKDLETTHTALAKAGVAIVMMLVKRNIKLSSLREASQLVDEANENMKRLCASLRGK